jgi:hypothetical protein
VDPRYSPQYGITIKELPWIVQTICDERLAAERPD